MSKFNFWTVGFQAVNLVLNAAVAALVFLLLLRLFGGVSGGVESRHLLAAGGAALLFTAHPVHVEAVANVVGQGELWAALLGLSALLLALGSVPEGSAGGALDRGGATHAVSSGGADAASAIALALRVALIALLYALALGAKEIAVTLPAVLLLVRTAERGGRLGEALRTDLAIHIALVGVAATYLVVRNWVLGGILGENPAALFVGHPPTTRIWTALSVLPIAWSLMVAPVDLAADYDPGHLDLVAPPALGGAVGLLMLLALLALAVVGWRRGGAGRLAAVGILWVVLVRLPVSNLVIPAGVILAERTLYLPSVGVAILAATALATLAAPESPRRPLALGGTGALLVLFALGSVLRTPVWDSTASVTNSFLEDSPTSWRAMRHYAVGLLKLGREEEGVDLLKQAFDILPYRSDLSSEVGARLTGLGRRAEARPYLEWTVEQWPHRIDGYNLLMELQLLEGEYRAVVETGAAGLRRAGADGRTFALLSEGWIGLGRYEVALRARRTAVALDEDDADSRARLAELGSALEQVRAARAQGFDPRIEVAPPAPTTPENGEGGG